MNESGISFNKLYQYQLGLKLQLDIHSCKVISEIPKPLTEWDGLKGGEEREKWISAQSCNFSIDVTTEEDGDPHIHSKLGYILKTFNLNVMYQ